jgi:hypothetical protein
MTTSPIVKLTIKIKPVSLHPKWRLLNVGIRECVNVGIRECVSLECVNALV